MKKIIISTILLIIIFTYFVPPYNELNNIMIIDSIKIIKKNNKYNITLREIIPKRNNSGLNYTHKYHKIEVNNISDIKKNIEKKENKKLYLKKAKFLITNINSNLIINTYNLKPKVIIVQ